MWYDDILYVIWLLVSIGAGKFVLKIPYESQRKLICTGFGVFLVLTVSSLHILHCFATVAIGAAVLHFAHPRICHIFTFVLMFGYLAFFRLVHLVGLPTPPSHTNMIQMLLTLKIVGLALEKTNAWKKLQERRLQIANIKDGTWVDASSGGALVEITDYDVEVQDMDFWEVFNYSFNYIGVLAGPYYRYRTYRDYFETPFKFHAPSEAVTLGKLKHAGIYGFLYLAASYMFPLDYMLSDEFYVEHSIFYRLVYIWMTFFVFRMRIYTGLTLGECVCTMAGFGAYPEAANVSSGEGPKAAQYMHLKRDAANRTYNFETIENTRVRSLETSITFREAMKHWNICVQYWLAANVYKRFPSKRYRIAATLLCSAFWHGFQPGHYVCIMAAPLYVPVEDMWNKLVRLGAVGIKRQVIDFLFWFATFFAYSYICAAFLLVSFHNIWRFYQSVYHLGYVLWAFMLLLGIILTKLRRTRSERVEDGYVDIDIKTKL